MRQRLFVFGTALLAVGACNGNRSTDRQAGAGAVTQPTTSPSASVPAGGGQRDLRPRAVVLSPFHGASAIDTMVRINVRVSCPVGPPCSTETGATLATIGSKIRILDSAGNATAVALDPTTAPGASAKLASVPAPEYPASFLPVAALRADENYTIEVRSDAEAVIGAFDSSAAEQSAGLAATNDAPSAQAIAIFTGSAPTVTRIDVGNDPRKPLTSVRVRFSEPVTAASLVAAGITFRNSAGSSLGGCIWARGVQRCADSSATEVSEAFDIVFPSAIAANDLLTGKLLLAGGVRGAGRTIADTAKMRGLTMTKVGASAALPLDLGRATWSACSPEGDLLCTRPQIKL